VTAHSSSLSRFHALSDSEVIALFLRMTQVAVANVRRSVSLESRSPRPTFPHRDGGVAARKRVPTRPPRASVSGGR
jgi:hypothetical protein